MKRFPIIYFSFFQFSLPIPHWGWIGAFFLLILSSCSGGQQYCALLDRADSLMSVQPDSAHALLCSIDSADLQRQRKSVRMRYELLRAEAQNKLYIPFRNDSVLREVADYYNRQGSPNDRLRSRYALGCAYRDLHEAPIALLTWEDAIAAADTTAADCDYATLFRVYGQMAEMYFRQYMPEKQLEAEQKFCDYALLAVDSLSYISGLLKKNDAYLALGDTIAVFKNIEHVRQLYLERGMMQEAAQAYPSAIHIALDRGEYERADSMMQIFENESGLFDSLGNIAPTYEIYYYHKGSYYLGTLQLVSAESQFRRLLNIPANQLNAYQGLLALFRVKSDLDSTLYYSTLYESALAKYLSETPNDAIVLAESMYDYSREQRIAEKRNKEATRRGRIILCLILLVGIGYWNLRRIAKKKEMAYQNTTRSYLLAIQEIEKLNQEISFIKCHAIEESKELLQGKEERIDQLEGLIERYKEKLGQTQPTNDNEALMRSDIVQLLRDISNIRSYKENGSSKINVINPRACENEEWQELIDAIKKYHYSFYYLITTEKRLPKLQFKVCVL